MSEQKGKFGKKQKIMIAALATVVVGGSVGLMAYNKQAQAEKVELQKKEEADKKAYIQLKSDVKQAVQSAYDTRNEKQIELAESLIKKLNEADQKYPKERMKKLHSLLNQVKTTEESITKAEKTKKEEDIKTAEKNIEAEKDSYLANDKKAHNERLNKLKKVIADEKAKAKAEKEKKEKETAAKKEADKSVVTAEQTTNEQGKDSTEEPPAIVEPQVAEQPTAVVEAPANVPQEGGGTPSVQPVAPQPTPEPTPAPPANTGGGNQGGNGGTTTPPTHPAEPTPDYEPAGRVSPWFMSYGEADAWAENLPSDQYNRANVNSTSFSDGTIRYCVTLS